MRPKPLAFNPSQGPSPGHFNGSFLWRSMKHSSEQIIESRALGTQWALCAHSRCPICLPSPTVALPLRTLPTLHHPTPAPPRGQLKGRPYERTCSPPSQKFPPWHLPAWGEISLTGPRSASSPSVHLSIWGSSHFDVQRLLSSLIS